MAYGVGYGLGGLGVLLFILGIIMAILWFIMPFYVIAIHNRLKEIRDILLIAHKIKVETVKEFDFEKK